MCGIFGVIAGHGHNQSLDVATVKRLRDRLVHRGPDGAGVWLHGNVALAHRRLAIRDISDAGAQPMASERGDIMLVYNGELYNDAQLRTEIQRVDPRPFRSSCDTETVIRALELWGDDALPKFRGMFALAWWDARTQQLTLARDPLGIKPLYYAGIGQELVFASEPGPILAHPQFSVRPNWAMVSAYLTTIRTVLESSTMFDGVHALTPGHALCVDASTASLSISIKRFWTAPPADSDAAPIESVHDEIESSIRRHLNSDVPVCAMLSGGLDSTITTTIAHDEIAELRTFCAGAPSESGDDDLSCASEVASALGVRHHATHITETAFIEQWASMVDSLGVPLSTPNEVAIHAVAQQLRADGCVVTISGEGADEFFGGYEAPLLAAWNFCRMDVPPETGGRFQLESNAWVAPRLKAALLRPGSAMAQVGDDSLVAMYDELFKSCLDDAGADADPLEAHLRFLQRVNLVGLLQRLDTSTMLASVEGRTPFADVNVAALACALPMSQKYVPDAQESNVDGEGELAVATAFRTKIALRQAFQQRIPTVALHRPKASFPLPFASWLPQKATVLRTSPFLREVFSNDAIETVASDPASHWRLAWPMANLAMWGDRWW